MSYNPTQFKNRWKIVYKNRFKTHIAPAAYKVTHLIDCTLKYCTYIKKGKKKSWK